MNSYESMWEDDETSRRVELLVNYSQHDAGITINEITPIKVTFLCPTSKAARRTIGVWTKTGRAMLAAQCRAAGHAESLEREIISRNVAGASA